MGLGRVGELDPVAAGGEPPDRVRAVAGRGGDVARRGSADGEGRDDDACQRRPGRVGDRAADAVAGRRGRARELGVDAADIGRADHDGGRGSRVGGDARAAVEAAQVGLGRVGELDPVAAGGEPPDRVRAVAGRGGDVARRGSADGEGRDQDACQRGPGRVGDRAADAVAGRRGRARQRERPQCRGDKARRGSDSCASPSLCTPTSVRASRRTRFTNGSSPTRRGNRAPSFRCGATTQ